MKRIIYFSPMLAICSMLAVSLMAVGSLIVRAIDTARTWIGEALAYLDDSLQRMATPEPAQISTLVSQTGRGVWSFVTNLFKAAGRTYCWQA